MKELDLLKLRGYMAAWVMFAMTKKDDGGWYYTDQVSRIRNTLIHQLAIHIRKKSTLRSYRNRNLFRLEMLNTLMTATIDRVFRRVHPVDFVHLTLCNAIDICMDEIITYLCEGGDPNLLHDDNVIPVDIAIKESNKEFLEVMING